MSEPTTAERVAELHRQAAADRKTATSKRHAAAAEQLAWARIHGNAAAAAR